MTKHLSGILSPVNREYGFSVIEMTDGAVCLILNFQTMAAFNQHTTAEDINTKADSIRKGK